MSQHLLIFQCWSPVAMLTWHVLSMRLCCYDSFEQYTCVVFGNLHWYYWYLDISATLGSRVEKYPRAP